SFLLGTGALFGRANSIDAAPDEVKSPFSARAKKSLQIRQEAALRASRRPEVKPKTNGDEDRYPDLFASYTKGFSHSEIGEVDPSRYRAMLYALSTQSHEDFEKIPIGYGRKLVNIESAFTFDLEGGDSWTFPMPPPPSFSSEESAAEMVELYWQAALRD